MQTMLKMAGDNTSSQSSPIGITQTMTGKAPSIPNFDQKAADAQLWHYVDEMLQLDKRFVGLSSYIYNINFHWSSMIHTACAGHGFIFFNPEFWDKLEPEKKKTIIAHEIWHLVLNHLNRKVGYDSDTHNQAADHVINNTLKDEGFMMDQGMDFGGITPCCDPRFRGMSTEQIYRILINEKQQNLDMSGGSGPSGQGTDSEKGEGFPHPTKDQIEDMIEAVLAADEDLQEVIEQAEQAAEQAQGQVIGGKGIGSDAGNVMRDIVAQKEVKILQHSYEQIFEEFLIDPLSGGKRTYLRPSRRQQSGGLRLKGKYPKRGKKNRLTRLVYALDVSGSINQKDAQLFLESAKTIKEKLNPKEMIVMLWDTRIVLEKTFREDEPINKISVQAGGGTNLKPVYNRVKQLNPEALVIFTDLQVSIPPKPSWETIWFVPTTKINPYYLNTVTYGKVYKVPEN